VWAGELAAMLECWRRCVSVGALLGRWWLRIRGAFAGWRWGGRVGRVLLLGWWHCRGVGAGLLVSEGEGPDNQHEVEGGRGDGRGESMTKGRGMEVIVRGDIFLSLLLFWIK
jgi:hypothetical protein